MQQIKQNGGENSHQCATVHAEEPAVNDVARTSTEERYMHGAVVIRFKSHCLLMVVGGEVAICVPLLWCQW
jgi:deoxycytidylate deaminase